ncbi:LOW QUALITY PROTEIN: coiled-coil domain-containing protein 174 [Frankliniella occidentalis]|uniref:LOW QUALITY PROTEIN: coiled-coil domain-containing protein 174 n=1 Tax=Frankliniella occidentalis TaxID=133901 RepID=A0A9C6TTD3_FRAOC|nr:LOW QUALITY PROTEIN: coiled-coil domain-containing protein 174 [Frankliniella occidentalis]
MNSGSKLDISQSSLLSLKAELARKHEEATKAKAQAQGSFIKPLAKPAKSSIFSHTNASNHSSKKKELSAEEESKIQRSRSALEEKAKIYDSLSQQSSFEGHSEYLVNFAKKSSYADHSLGLEEQKEEEERRRREKEEEEEEARRADSDEYEIPSDPEDDWVDFTDSLGRTRRCLRRDLSRFRELDDRLFKSLEPKSPPEAKDVPSPNSLPPAGYPAGCAAPDLLSDDMRREQQRLKWEEEEEKLRSKSEIHYQDVLFDEARSHGVGFFAFARDEAVRRTQQEDMRKLRKETESKQKAALTQRDRRAQLMRARLRAAHNRKRAREGLPPLAEDEDLPGEKVEEPAEPEEPAPAPSIQRASGPRPRPSPSVRPWDVGKEGVPVLSQSEWNDQQRSQRKQEFAPPSFYEDRRGERSTGPSERRSEQRRPAPAKHHGSKRAAQAGDEEDDDDDLVGPRPPRESPPPGPAPPAPQDMSAWLRVPPPPFMPPVHLPPPSMLWPPAAAAPPPQHAQPPVPGEEDGPRPPRESPPPGPAPPAPQDMSAWMRVPPPPFMPPVHLPPPSMLWPPAAAAPPPQHAQPPVPGEEDEASDAARGGLFFTSKRPRRDWRAQQQEVRLPMEEEEDFTATEPPPPGVSDSPPRPPPPPPQARDKKRGGSDAVGRGVGAEIAPPPTLEYFGPTEGAADRSRRAAQRLGQGQGQDDLSASITAGLRYLRNQAEDRERKRTDKGWADFVG